MRLKTMRARIPLPSDLRGRLHGFPHPAAGSIADNGPSVGEALTSPRWNLVCTRLLALRGLAQGASGKC